MEPQIRYCTTDDGVRIAYCVEGAGPVLIACPLFIESFSLDHLLPEQQAFMRRLGANRRLVRFDWRGTGLSDRDVPDGPFTAAQVLDLQAVAGAFGDEKVSLWANGNAGPPALRFALQHPDRLTNLLLVDTCANLNDAVPVDSMRGFSELARTNWPLLAQMFGDMSMRQEAPEAGLRWGQVFFQSTTGEFVATAIGDADASDRLELADLRNIHARALVLHRRNDAIFAFDLGRNLASALPNATFVPQEGVIAAAALGDSESVLRAVLPFLGDRPTPGQPELARPPASGTAVILFTDIVSSTALTERMGDVAFRDASRALDAGLRTAIRNSGGSVVEGKVLGDGILATFSSAAQAIDGARRCLTLSSASELGLHIGLHAGDVIREDDNVYGGAVNIASRICGLSAPGEILVSDVVRGMARSSAGVEFEDRGEQEMKGVGEPVRVYAVRGDA